MLPAQPRAWIVSPAAQALRPVANAPTISAVEVEPLRSVDVKDESDAARSVLVPFERELCVTINGTPLVRLMTLAGAPEFLVMGYLRNQGLIGEASQLRTLEVDPSATQAKVQTHEPLNLSQSANVAIESACGLGRALGVEQALNPRSLARADILSILEQARAHDEIHRAAGSVHSAILFSGTELLAAVEDVSRHNGVDTVAGWMLLHGVDGTGKILFTTGRLTAELVLKAAHCGIATLISRNGTTATGCQIAAQLNLTLIGRAANKRFVCFTGAERIL